MPARPKKAASKTAKAKTASTRTTVASVAAEVSELRDLVSSLLARVEELERRPAGAAGAATARVAAAVPAAAAVGASATPPSNNEDVELVLRQLLISAIQLAQEPMPDDPEDADRQFERFAALCHSSRTGTPALNSSLRTYTWHQMRKNVAIYLGEADDPGSYEVTRSDPRKITAQSTRVKLFLRARTRMPTPITFRRDNEADGAWRVEASSL